MPTDMRTITVAVSFTLWARIGLWFATFLAQLGMEVDVDNLSAFMVRHMRLRLI